MKRILLIVTPLFVAMVFSGCWVTMDWEDECTGWPFECSGGSDGDGYLPECPDDDCQPDCDQPWSEGMICVPGERRYCDTPTYCSWGEQVCRADGAGWGECYESSPPPGCSGFAYDQDCCLEAGGCCQDWEDADWDGDYDESIGNCEEPPAVCTEDADCSDGYCDAEEGESGLCVSTGSCDDDADCETFGAGLSCDERGICAPEAAPCPSGECGCESDAECGDGMLCIASRCTASDAVCFFDFECGDGGACLDNECHAGCTSDACCPSGQSCSSEGLCLEPAVGPDGCVFDEDCGEGFRCINATCFASCDADADCADNETCRADTCRADASPSHECSADADCGDPMLCLRGTCRLPCAADINCTGALDTCSDDGFCSSAAEADPECTRASDCADGQSCLSNHCVDAL